MHKGSEMLHRRGVPPSTRAPSLRSWATAVPVHQQTVSECRQSSQLYSLIYLIPEKVFGLHRHCIVSRTCDEWTRLPGLCCECCGAFRCMRCTWPYHFPCTPDQSENDPLRLRQQHCRLKLARRVADEAAASKLMRGAPCVKMPTTTIKAANRILSVYPSIPSTGSQPCAWNGPLPWCDVGLQKDRRSPQIGSWFTWFWSMVLMS